MDSQTGYNISETAASYAALCGVLAGFAFVAITLIISGQLVDRERLSKHGKVTMQRLAEVLVLAFFTLIGSTVLQTIRSGVSEDMSDKYKLTIALSLTVVVDFQMIIAILTLFTAFFIMVNNFLFLDKKSKRRMAWMFDITTLIALLFNYMTNTNLWHIFSDLSSDRTAFILVWEITIPVLAYVVSKKTPASMQEVFVLIVSATVLACTVATFLWSSAHLFRVLYDNYWITYIISFDKSVVLGIVAGWLHQLSQPQEISVPTQPRARS